VKNRTVRIAAPYGLDAMIKLTRLNGDEFILNASLIQYVESRPDTFVTLTTSERLIVKETVDTVVKRCLDYSRTVRLIPALRPELEAA
jgi:flagellar protein FlbD